MKICLLGEYSGDIDEGMKKISLHLAKELSKKHKVLTIDLKNIFQFRSLKSINYFKPDIIHYIHGPSVKSLILLKIINMYFKNAKTIVFATHPSFTSISEHFIPLLKPDIVLTQSFKSENMFKKFGCRTKFMPCGVDIEEFFPISDKRKEELREIYGIDKEKFMILHVGSIKEGRNIRLFGKLQGNNNQVVIVGALSPGIDRKTLQYLKDKGCIVWTKYFKNIYEIYAMADCYIFSVLNKDNVFGKPVADSIEIPLSVLEAMACNLPIISYNFGALSRIFQEGDGFFFIDEDKDFDKLLKDVKNIRNINTREKIAKYSWKNITEEIEKIYIELYVG